MNLAGDLQQSQPQESALSSSPGWKQWNNEVAKLLSDDVPRAISAPPHLQDRWAAVGGNANDPGAGGGVPQQWTSLEATDIRYDEDYPAFYNLMSQHYNRKLPRPVESHTLYNELNLLNHAQQQADALSRAGAAANHRQQMMLRQGGLQSIQETPGAAELLQALQTLQLQQDGAPSPGVGHQLVNAPTPSVDSEAPTPTPFGEMPLCHSPFPLPPAPGAITPEQSALLQLQANQQLMQLMQQQQQQQHAARPPGMTPPTATSPAPLPINPVQAAAAAAAAAQGHHSLQHTGIPEYQAAYAAAFQAAMQQQSSMLALPGQGIMPGLPPGAFPPGAFQNPALNAAALQHYAAQAGQLAVPNPFYNNTAAAAAAAAAAVTAATAAAANSLAGQVPFPPKPMPPGADPSHHHDHDFHHDHGKHAGGPGGGPGSGRDGGNAAARGGDRRHRLGRRERNGPGGGGDGPRGDRGGPDRNGGGDRDANGMDSSANGDEGPHAKYESLDEVVGQLLAVAQDQNGCRFLQRKFDEGGSTAVAVVFKELLENMVTLMKDPFGNYLVQKLLDRCSEDQRLQVLKSVASKGDLVAVALNTHGTRAVQKLIETLHGREQRAIVIDALRGGVTALIKDLNGNHVVQRCLQRLGPEDSQFIYDAACANCVEIATHRHGCCVLQRCVDFATPAQKRRLVEEIAQHALVLSQDAFGNYVVQYVLELGDPSACATVIVQLGGHYGELSMQKFSSNVVERCLKLAGLHKERQSIIQELVVSPLLPRLLQDSYGNYVVQSALAAAQGANHTALVDAIKPFVASLRGTPHGKRILQKIHGK